MTFTWMARARLHQCALGGLVMLSTGVSGDAALADMADVVDARATETPAGWRFDVTVAHPDEGWDHYADAWRVVSPDGTVLGVRTLHHPHVSEQPFTRSLGGVRVPASVNVVRIEARDSVHGWGGASVTLRIKPGS